MATLDPTFDGLIKLMMQLAGAVDATLTSLVLVVRGVLGQMGAPHWLQTAFPLVVAVMLIVWGLRLPGALSRVYVALVLLDVIYHIVLPVWQS